MAGLRTTRIGGPGARRCRNLVQLPMRSVNGDVLYKCGDGLVDEPKAAHIGALAMEQPQYGPIYRPEYHQYGPPPPPLPRRRGRPPMPPGECLRREGSRCVRGRTPSMKVALPADASLDEKRYQCDFDTLRWVKVQRFAKKARKGEYVDKVRERENAHKTEYRCRCGMEGNRNYVPNRHCEENVGPKPR